MTERQKTISILLSMSLILSSALGTIKNERYILPESLKFDELKQYEDILKKKMKH